MTVFDGNIRNAIEMIDRINNVSITDDEIKHRVSPF